MKSMVSQQKMSKKAQREMAKQKRNLWPINPITRVKESGKAYNRKRKWDIEV